MPKTSMGETSWLNAICLGFNFSLVQRLGDGNQQTVKNVLKTFTEAWIRFMGTLDVVVLDSGTEFMGYFPEACGEHGITLVQCDLKTPWQNGRTERAGCECKRQFKHTIRKEVPVDEDEYVALGMMCCSIRNQYNNRSGSHPCSVYSGTPPAWQDH